MDLRELAGRLNLSVTTVSRALNGFPEVKESTRQRVVAAARRYGYVPNQNARRLQKGRSEAVGFVMPARFGDFTDPFFSELLVGLGEHLHRHDLDLIVTAAPSGPDEILAYRRMVEGRRVDAMVIGRTRRRDDRIAYLLDRGFPFISHGRTEIDRPYAHLDMDHEHGFFELVGRLVRLGHHRLALLNGPEDLMLAHLRRAGFLRGVEQAGMSRDDVEIVSGEMTEQGGHEVAGRLLQQAVPPTALVCANDMMAVGALRAARQLGFAVPDDVSVTGYDDLRVSGFTEPPLTTLRQPIQESGRALAEKLMALLSGTAPEDLSEVWRPDLIVRESDGPLPARTAA